MSAATFSDIRSLHGPGAISVVSDRKGSHANTFITCGTDGTLYVWDEKTFTTEKSSADVKNVGEQTYSIISWHGNNVYFGYLEMDLISGMDKKRVGMASLDNLEEITPLMTFNLEPTCIDASEEFLVAGSSEFIIKVTKHKDGDALANVEVDGEALCVKIDPKEEFLAAAISDGSIIILNLQEATEEETPQVTKIAAVFPAVNTISVESPRAEMSWSRNGDFLYVPSTGTIKTIDRRDWTVDSDILKAPGRELDHFSVCSLSPCGWILVASTMNRHICLWNLSDQTFIAQYEYNRNSPGKTFVTGLHFASFDTRSVIVVDSNEGMCLVKNAVPIKLQKPESREQVETEIAKKRKQILDSDEEEDNDEQKRPGSFLDDAADEDTRLSIDIGAIKKKFGYTNQSSLDDYFDKDGAEKELLTDFGGLEKSGPVVQKVTQIVEYEPPAIPNHFASGSTPRNAGSRYLKWNGFGMIRSVQDDDANNIEIEFHNASIHSEIIFENTANYSLGDLSDEAIALANTVNTEDSEEMAELWVHHVTAWDSSNRKWTTNLPKGENPVDILVSRKMVTVLTDQRNLRVFTLQGTQRCVIAHPGPSLTACCFETRVAVVSLAGSEYFEKERRKAQHNYIATVYNLDPRRWFQSQSNVSTVNVPVKPGETIIWTGYTSEGKLCVVDSSYSVRILTHGGFWLPIFEGSSISRSKSDAFWPIAVMDGVQKQFRYLYCRGSKYPLISLKLTPTIVPWQLPLCQPEAEKSKYEEELLLNELDQSEAQRTGAESLMAKHLQCIVKLFALSCKSERETRAYELAQLVSSTKGIQALVNFASKSRRNVLSEKIAVFGRDNEAASSVRQDDFLAPKRVVMARRSTAIATETIVSSQQDIFADSQDPESEMGSIRGTLDLDVSMQSSPVRTFSKNPFKRSAEPTQESSSSSRSVFDHLEESFENPRKRTREETASNPAPAGKQTKLDFGKGKENKLNPYAMWLEENEDSLKKTFSGDVADFEKFCVGQFRILPAAQKKILKDRIEALST